MSKRINVYRDGVDVAAKTLASRIRRKIDRNLTHVYICDSGAIFAAPGYKSSKQSARLQGMLVGVYNRKIVEQYVRDDLAQAVDDLAAARSCMMGMGSRR